jgi:phospholipid/cholesterol/gamma-HCH transport system ATP-binding protein
MIEFRNVSFAYGERDVLKDVSFTIHIDEQVAILGESGEGKTTILRLILGLLHPDSGEVRIDGRDLATVPEGKMHDIRMKFGIVFQQGALFDSLSVKENVAFCMREYSHRSEEEIDKVVRAVLGTVGLEHAIDLMPEELSGGMLRRVAIARSLASCKSEMMLYDEPTSGLDPVNTDAIIKLIGDLARNGDGFIIITHDVLNAIRVADRFLFLRRGQLLCDGGREQLLKSCVPEVASFIATSLPDRSAKSQRTLQ